MITRRIRFILLLSLLLLGSVACSSKTTITEQDVRSFYAAVEQALNARDTNRVLDLLSDDVQLHMQATTPDGEQSLSMNKRDYAENLQQSFASMQDYQYRIDNLQIEISTDSKSAQVQVTITENMTIGGDVIHASTRENTRLELRGGKVRAVSVEAFVTVH